MSQHIKALEGALDNVRLFRRVGQHMSLTHAGEELAEAAREVLALTSRAEERIRGLRGQVAGSVVLGCGPSSGERLLPPLLATFHARFPGISVALAIAPPDTLADGLANQQFQVVLADEPLRRRGWESQLLATEPLALVAPRGHLLLQQEQVPPGMLRSQSFVLPRAGTVQRRLIDDGLRRRGISTADIQVALETSSAGVMVQAVREGMGLAFVPHSRLPRGRDTGIVGLAGMNLQQEWYAVRSRERNARRAVQELYNHLCSTDARKIIQKVGLKPPTD